MYNKYALEILKYAQDFQREKKLKSIYSLESLVIEN